MDKTSRDLLIALLVVLILLAAYYAFAHMTAKLRITGIGLSAALAGASAASRNLVLAVNGAPKLSPSAWRGKRAYLSSKPLGAHVTSVVSASFAAGASAGTVTIGPLAVPQKWQDGSGTVPPGPSDYVLIF